jgi:hypothetical protein
MQTPSIEEFKEKSSLVPWFIRGSEERSKLGLYMVMLRRGHHAYNN